MKSKEEYLNELFNELASAPRGILLLDYDGTLAPFRTKRDEATPYPMVPGILEEIQKSPRTRLVIVTGRALDDILPLLGLETPPEIWGSHGWEHLEPDGRRVLFPIAPEIREALQKAATRVEEIGGALEKKPASVALHWRGLDAEEIEKIQDAAMAEWQEIAQAHGLEVKPFDGGLELRVPGRDKGMVVNDILGTGFTPGMPVAYLGDDLTDEDAFAALERRGLRVLVRSEDRTTRADCRIEPPGELIAFLERWRDAARNQE